MIEKIQSVMLECDNCKSPYESYNGFSIFVDEQTAVESASEDGWSMHNSNGKHYCGKCHETNESGEFLINMERFKDEN